MSSYIPLRKVIIASLCLCGLLLGSGSRQVGAQAKATASLPALIAALADGPIQIRPTALPQGAISAPSAAQAAQQAVGIPFKATQARSVTITDRENLSRLVHGLPCWLLPSYQPITLLPPHGPPRRETMYAIVNARTGLLLEAFTTPRAAWWRRVNLTNETLLQDLSTQLHGVKVVPATAPPRVSLASAYPFLHSKHNKTDLSISGADQIIARHFIYTDFSQKVKTNTPRGPHYRLRIFQRPVWYISREGLNSPFMGSVPAMVSPMSGKTQKMRLPRTEELNDISDSTTGELYETLEYRSGLLKESCSMTDTV